MIEFDKNVIYEGEEYCVKNIREVNSEYYKLEIYKCKNKKIQSFDLVYCIENSEKFMYEHYPYDYRLYDDNRYIKLIRFVFYLYECKKIEENEEIESKRLKELKEWDGVI